MRTPMTIAILSLLLLAADARAVQVEDICRLKGAETNVLTGMGLVVGLPGTGDGGKFLPAMRPLAAICNRLIDPTTTPLDLADAKNVALVALSATLPEGGVREGDHVDVHVASVGPAKSLAGGVLFLIPMTGPLPGAPVMAFAQGPISIEDPKTPTVGVIKAGSRSGAQLTRDVMSQYLDKYGRITLVIQDDNASWPMASNLESLLNAVLAPDGPNIARAVDQKNVVVEVPPSDRADPAAFISRVLQSYIDPDQIAGPAKVIINEKLKNITITGDVTISPVVISHKGLKITTLIPEVKPTTGNPRVETSNFVAIDPQKRGGARLTDLINAFNQLNVDPEDRIAIIRQIARSGKLHAQLIEE